MKKLKNLKSFESFKNEEFQYGGEETEVRPDVDTPAPSKPKKPSIIPTEKPSVDPAPLASDEDVVDRVEDLYLKMSEEDKREIDSFFDKK